MDWREQLRAALWGALDWPECLHGLARRLQSQRLTRAVVEPAVGLARAYESIDPDRSHAMRMYFLAWNAWPDRGSLLGRAIELCREAGDLERAATMARLGHQHSGDPRAALAEGIAWLDANRPADAVAPLAVARDAMPDDPMVGLLCATAERAWDDPRPQVRALMERGTAAGFACAARIVRSCGFEGDDYGSLLAQAFRADPTDNSVYGLLEDWLIERGDSDGLAGMYRVRSEAAPSVGARIDDYRRAGSKLVRREYLAGLGLRLLEQSVTRGYRDEVPIPGHIASLSMIRDYAAGAGLDHKLLALLASGLSAPMPDYDRLWMAMTGLEVARRVEQEDTAGAYAAILAELAPEHPALQSYCVDSGLVEEPWALTGDAVPLDHFTSANHVVSDWRHDKVGLAAAEVPAARQPPPTDYDLSSIAGGPEVDLPPLDLEALEDAPVIAAAPMPSASIIPTSAASAIARHRDAPLSAKPAVPANARARAHRALVPADVRILSGVAGGAQLAAVTRDLSATGLFLVTDAELSSGAVVRIELELPGADDFALAAATVDARVVRRGFNGYGVEFIDPPAALVAAIEGLST